MTRPIGYAGWWDVGRNMFTTHYPTALGFTRITAMSIPVEIRATNVYPSVSTLEAQPTDIVPSTGNVVLVSAHNKPRGQSLSLTHTFALTTDAHNAQAHASKTSVSARPISPARSVDAPIAPTLLTQNYTVKFIPVPWYLNAHIKRSASLMASVTARSTFPVALYVAADVCAWSGQVDSSLDTAINTSSARDLGVVCSPGQAPTFAPRTNAVWKGAQDKRKMAPTIASNIPASMAAAHRLCGILKTAPHDSAPRTSVQWRPVRPRPRRSTDTVRAMAVRTDHAIH